MEKFGSPTEVDHDSQLLKATRELRSRLKLSQAAFGQQINRTVNTVVRYELQVAPRGETLIPYAALAINSGFDDLATLFRAALIRDFGPDLERVLAWKADSRENMAVPHDVRLLVKAFLKFMGARDLLPVEELARNGLKSLLLRNFSTFNEKNKKQF